jgi:hypothetical protein
LLESSEVSVLDFTPVLRRRTTYRVSWWKFARRWSVSAEGLMDVYRRDAFVREGLWTGIRHFSCSVVMHRCEPIGSTQMCAVRIAIERVAVWGRYEQWHDLGSSLSLSFCLIYLSISANQPNRLNQVTAWLSEVLKSILVFADCRGGGLRLHNTVAFRLLVVNGTHWLLSYLLTYSMEQNRSWEINRFSSQKFSAFYGTRRFITSFTSARHLSLSRASSIQSIPPILLPEDPSLYLPIYALVSWVVSFPQVSPSEPCGTHW